MLAVCGALAACGYKGPLYMPGSPQDHPRPVPPPALKPGQTAAPEAAPPARAPNDSGHARQANPVPDLFPQ
ncbi:lipoprotein [Bordetella sp. FB-8]|uniref:LPS translocon maturation chaperone LptM n=1 Tax=Bordetella sp. FB-8 TaxID=1159870 RepID=UPI00037E13EF|nr:lipoprotein [Bordetella sp. FB-8]